MPLEVMTISNLFFPKLYLSKYLHFMAPMYLKLRLPKAEIIFNLYSHLINKLSKNLVGERFIPGFLLYFLYITVSHTNVYQIKLIKKVFKLCSSSKSFHLEHSKGLLLVYHQHPSLPSFCPSTYHTAA